MPKLDFKKDYKDLYAPPRQPVVVDVPAFKALMIDGVGAPESEDFMNAIQALYAVSYGIKMMPKSGTKPKGYMEYTVAPLEALWGYGDKRDTKLFRGGDRNKWPWTAIMLQPDFVTSNLVKQVVKKVKEKKDNPSLEKITLKKWKEGKCVQMMHVGGYDQEAPTIDAIHAFAQESGFKLRDRHHEVYIGDPRLGAKSKLKTVIRQPVR